jgi:hypothetical protein
VRKKNHPIGWLLFETFVLYAGLLPDSAIPMLNFSLHNHNEGNNIISKKDEEGRIEHLCFGF